MGFEVLYWIPFLRALGLRPEQCVALSRGGVAEWYRDVADEYVELYDIFEPDDLCARQRERIEASGGQKHVDRSALDDEAIRRAQEHLGEDLDVLHPSLMFRRFRPVWMHRRTLGAVRRDLVAKPLAAPSKERGDYIAVKLYHSDAMPRRPDVSQLLTRLGAQLAGNAEVRWLDTGLDLDDHVEVPPPDQASSPVRGGHATNLARQADIIAGARALVCTYGGFAYLGPLLGTPTTSLYATREFSPVHLAVAHWALARCPPLDLVSLETTSSSGLLGLLANPRAIPAD